MMFKPQWCSTEVVNQFAKVAHHVNFVYCYSHLKSRPRKSETPSSDRDAPLPISNTSSSAPGYSLQDLTAQLTTFFPFDPYSLPRSKMFVADAYLPFEDSDSGHIAEEDEDDEEEDEDEEDEEDEEEEEEVLEGSRQGMLGLPPNRDIPRATNEDDGVVLGASLDAMSISPARPIIPRTRFSQV